MPPSIAVLIPAYNAEKFLPDSLRSVAEQTVAPAEVVIVDDGSSDRTRQIAREWASRSSSRCRVISQPNMGIGPARNKGIGAVTSEFVAFLDADDWWLPTKLEVVAPLLTPGVDLVCHDEFVKGGPNDGQTFRYGPWTEFEDLLWKGNCVSTSAATVRRSALEAVGGFSSDPGFNGVEDYDLWLRLAFARYRFAYVHEVCGYYRVHGDGISSKPEEHCRHTLNVLEAHAANASPNAGGFRSRKAAILRSAGRGFMRRRERARAAVYFREAVRASPFSLRSWALRVLNQAGIQT